MKIYLTLLLLNLYLISFGQGIDTQLQEIRKRFYGLNDVELKMEKIDSLEFYFSADQLKKVIIKNDKDIHEYYFDLKFMENQAYFIYTINYSENAKNENRYYFEEDHLIRWLDNQKEVTLGSDISCITELKLIATSNDVLTILNNYRLNKINPSYESKALKIKEIIEHIDTKELRPDTVEVKDVPEEAYFFYEIIYYDRLGNEVKLLSFEGGDHAASTEVSYFQNDQIIYTLVKGGDVFGHSYQTHTYYDNGKQFRYKSERYVTGNWGMCENFMHTYIPKLSH